MRRALALVVVPLLLSPAQQVGAGELVAHASVTLSADEVRDVFLGEKQLAAGVKLVPVDNAAVQQEFAAKLLHIEVPKYTSLWMKKSFREGLNAPAVKSNDAEVLAFVKSTPGAVGYVSVAPAGVRVIARF
jgi:hypothetical protein